MPQLDFTVYLSQLVWLFITFGVLYITMAKIALPRIGEVIEERRDRIAKDLDSAQSLRSETDEAIASYEKALKDARNEAHEIAQSTRDKLTAKTEKKRNQVEEKLAAKLEDAEAQIVKMTNAAMAEVSEISTETTATLIKTLLGEDADIKKVSKAVTAQLAS